MVEKEKFQNMVDKINENAGPYCSKSLTVRRIPDEETPEPTDDD